MPSVQRPFVRQSKRRRGRVASITVAVAMAWVLSSPAGAQAITAVMVSGGTLQIGDTGADNDIWVDDWEDGFVEVHDVQDQSLSALPPCVSDVHYSVRCPFVAGTPITISAGSGDDRFYIRAATSPVTFDGGPGQDVFESAWGTTHDHVNGGDGNDRLVESGGNDEVHGGPGDDVLEEFIYRFGVADDGADSLDGGDGIDRVDYGPYRAGVTATIDGVANDGQTGEGEGDNVLGTIEQLTGSGGADILTGSPGPDVIDGAGGFDLIDGGLGSDVLRGGDGVLDEVTYASRTAPVAASIDGIANDGVAAEGDQIVGDVEILRGGSGPDTLVGSNDTGEDEVLRGGPGDDVLDGGLGRDDLNGGGGTDTVTYASRTAPVDAPVGTQVGAGQVGENDGIASDVEHLIGGSGADTLTGGVGPTWLEGRGGSDTLVGLGAVDTLDGGLADDILDGGGGGDTFTGGAGTHDRVSYADRWDGVRVDLANAASDDGEEGEGDVIGPDIEDIGGGHGDDVLVGSVVPNALRGSDGDDVLTGGLGADVLDGGGGEDRVSYAERATSVTVNLTTQAGGALGEADTYQQVEDATTGSGGDTVTGNGELNRIAAGPGDDTVAVQGDAAADDVDCGDGADALTRDLTDTSTNCEAVTPAVDKTPPTITITRPAEGQHFAQGAAITSAFTCDDGAGSGVATCIGPPTVVTSSPGTLLFTVGTTDKAGNAATQTVTYVVDPPVVPLVPQVEGTPGKPSAPAEPTEPGNTPVSGVVALGKLGRSIAVSKAGSLNVPLACTGQARCVGEVWLTVTGKGARAGASDSAPAKVQPVAKSTYTVEAGGQTKVRLKLNAAGRKLLARRKAGLKAQLGVAPQGAIKPLILKTVTLKRK